jgi:hypothetical protein
MSNKTESTLAQPNAGLPDQLHSRPGQDRAVSAIGAGHAKSTLLLCGLQQIIFVIRSFSKRTQQVLYDQRVSHLLLESIPSE